MTISLKISRLSVAFISISLILLIISLTQNAYYVSNHEESVGSFGLIAFLLGWMNINGPGVAWLANPALIISLIKQRKGQFKQSLIYAIAGIIFALSFLLFNEIISNEAGSTREITGYDLGYWLWLSSISINLVGAIAVYAISLRSEYNYR